MAHDSQLAREAEQSAPRANALSKGSKTCADVVADWLRLYAEMPYMRGEHEVTEGVILFYLDSLAKLRNPVALHRAFQWCRDHINFLPQPKEIHEAYEIAAGKLMAEESQQREAIELCGDCRGTGWKLLPHPNAPPPAVVAISCDCRKKKSA